jgi:hypothetical protein
VLLHSCKNIPANLKDSCERYNVYFYTGANCYVFIVKKQSYGSFERPYGYFIFEDGNQYYLRSEKGMNGTRLYYGEAYPNINAALSAAEVKNTGETIYALKSTDKNRKIICE